MKIHLRDLLWLLLVVCILAAWFRDHYKQSIWRERAESLKRIVDRDVHPAAVQWSSSSGRGKQPRVLKFVESRTD